MDASTAAQQGIARGAQGFAGGPPGGRPPGGAGALMLFGPFGSIATLGLLLLTYVVMAIVVWQFLKKAGLTPTVGLLMLVPVVNLGVGLWAAFAEWPITREMSRMNLVAASAGQGTVPEVVGMHTAAPMPGTKSLE